MKRVAPKLVSGAEQMTQMDDLSYSYLSGTNKLDNIRDNIADAVFGSALENIDIDNQAVGNYTYDKIGQLTSDVKEQIKEIKWRVDGKVSSVLKNDGTLITFYYDGLGNRVVKRVSGTTPAVDYYALDAQGNPLLVYDLKDASNLKLKEVNIFGSNRIGFQIYDPLSEPSGLTYKRLVGDKRFELTNHLGNVLAVINDRKITPISAMVKQDDYTKPLEWSAYGTVGSVAVTSGNLV